MFPYWRVTFRTLKTDQQQQLIIKLDGICLSIALGIPKTEISLKTMHAWGLIFHESHSYLVIRGPLATEKCGSIIRCAILEQERAMQA